MESTLDDEQPGAKRPVSASREAHLYRVLDCERPLAPSARYRLAGLDVVAIGRGPVTLAARGDGPRLAIELPDRWMSTRHGLLTREGARWLAEDAGSKNGTTLNGLSLAGRVGLAHGDVLALGHTLFLYLEAEPAPELPSDVEADAGTPGVTGAATLSAPLARDLAALERIAKAGISLVVQGETGTGKELVARAFHTLAGRAGAFIAVNCGALPEALIESELFGYRRGAFSDAKEDRLGVVRAAQGGTLFLDEIGDLPLGAQAAFLRVLQEREVLPLGATRAIPVDIRLCTASHRALAAMVERGEFRRDLYARLAGFTLVLPPLRERIEDLGLLIATLTRRHAADPSRVRFRPDCARALLVHRWPMNVRELETVLTAAFALAGDQPIALEHLPAALRLPELPANAPARPATKRAPTAVELEQLLGAHHGSIRAVARALGKQAVQVRRWLEKHGLDAARFRT